MAGKYSAARIARMAITHNNSVNVTPLCSLVCNFMRLESWNPFISDLTWQRRCRQADAAKKYISAKAVVPSRRLLLASGVMSET